MPVNSKSSTSNHYLWDYVTSPTVQKKIEMSIPFLKLIGPLKLPIAIFSTAKKSWKDITRLDATLLKNSCEENQKQLVITAAAVTCFYLALTANPLGILTSNICQIIAKINHLVRTFSCEFNGDELATLYHIFNTGLYTAALIYASPQLVLASTIAQAVLEFASSYQKFKENEKFEAFGFLLLGAIRTNQAYDVALTLPKMVLEKNELEEEAVTNHYSVKPTIVVPAKFKQLHERILKGKDTSFLDDQHPIKDLNSAIESKGITLTSNSMNASINIGAHFHSLGGQQVKGSNIAFRHKEIDGKIVTETDFKVNHVFREKMETIVDELKSLPKQDLAIFLKSNNVCQGNLTLEDKAYTYPNVPVEIESSYQIKCGGVGEITLGASKSAPSLYNRVVVTMDKEKGSTDLHFLLSLIGLDGALKKSSVEDIERLKIGQLYRAYHPKEATRLERTADFFDKSLPDLKSTMINKNSDMKEHFHQDLPKMEPYEPIPGRLRFTIPNLAFEAKKAGASALMSGVGHVSHAAAMIKNGALSSQMRYSSGADISGLSSTEDHKLGSADSVFTRLITQQNLEKDSTYNWPFHGDVQLIYSLDVLKTNTYQYDHDNYGDRTDALYENRSPLLAFVKDQARNYNHSNEVMVKDLIPPDKIVGCLVGSEESKNNLIGALQKEGLITIKNGIKWIRNTPLDKFIHVGTKFTSSLVAKA